MSPRLPSRRSKDKAAGAAEEQGAAQEPQEQPDGTEAPEAAKATKVPEAEQAPDSEKAPKRASRARRAKAQEPTAEEPAKASAEAEVASAESEPEKPAPTRRRRGGAQKAAAESEPAAEPAKRGRRRAKPAQEKAEAEKPAPARKSPDGAPRRVLVSARARYVRTSPRKARMICGHIRGRSVHDARAILEFTPRGVAREWSKLLESAVANAEHNHELLEDDLVVREAYADAGPTIKRFRPRALGRATSIHKRTSHLTITLAAGAERK